MNGKLRYILISVLCDILLLAVLLLSFAWHHHVKRMSDTSDDGGIGIVGKDELDKDEDDKDKETEGESEDGGNGGNEDVADEGDFGGTLPDVFVEEGVVDKGDGYYRSHDIYMTVTEVTEPVDDYVAKYFIYDVYVRNTENLFAVASDTRRPFTELIDVADDPIGAVSGDFWGNSAEVAVRNGKVLVESDRIGSDICVLYRDGTMEIVSPREYSKDYFDGKDVYQVWDFGPSFLDGKGKAYESFDEYSDITSRNPRSSIGYYEPGHYVFIVVEGRVDLMYEGELEYFKGMRLPDLAKVYEKLGVALAYNLDGGDSAFAYYDGEIIRQDYERAEDPNQEPREIYDIIAVGEVENE